MRYAFSHSIFVKHIYYTSSCSWATRVRFLHSRAVRLFCKIHLRVFDRVLYMWPFFWFAKHLQVVFCVRNPCEFFFECGTPPIFFLAEIVTPPSSHLLKLTSPKVVRMTDFSRNAKPPDIRQVVKLNFLGTNSNKTKISIWICTARYQDIWLSRFGGIRRGSISSGNYHHTSVSTPPKTHLQVLCVKHRKPT